MYVMPFAKSTGHGALCTNEMASDSITCRVWARQSEAVRGIVRDALNRDIHRLLIMSDKEGIRMKGMKGLQMVQEEVDPVKQRSNCF